MSESIYGWIKQDPAQAARAPRHKSRHDPKAPVPASTIRPKKAAAATIGRTVKDTVRPTEFLRAGAKSSELPEPHPGFRRETTKPPVPTRHDRPVMGVKSQKNFVVANAVENILAAPRVVERGEPDYLRKADYGRVPEYLSDVRAEIAAEQEFIEGMIAAQSAVYTGPEPTPLPEHERLALLDALKTKWDTVNHEYQKITFKRISSTNSTAGAIRRKEECERQLAELERDIERLSGKGPVLVVDDA